MLATRAIAASRPIAPPPRGEGRGAGDSGDAGEFLAALDAASDARLPIGAGPGPRSNDAAPRSAAVRHFAGAASSPSPSASAAKRGSGTQVQPEPSSAAADAAVDVAEADLELLHGIPQPGASAPPSTSGTERHSGPSPTRLSETAVLWAMPSLPTAAPVPPAAARDVPRDGSDATDAIAPDTHGGGAFGAGWSIDPSDGKPPMNGAGADPTDAASIGVLPGGPNGSVTANQSPDDAIGVARPAQSEVALLPSSASLLQDVASSGAAAIRPALGIAAAQPPERQDAPADDSRQSHPDAVIGSADPDDAGVSPPATASPSATVAGAGSDAANIVDQVANRLAGVLAAGRLEVVLRLHPPELGELNVRMQVDGRDVTAWFESPLPPVQQALTQGMEQLRAGLANAGFNLNDAWVGGDAWRPRGGAVVAAARSMRPVGDDATEPPTGASPLAPGLGVSVYV
jgi:flagellar hook-length control protein FliK